jgi:D-amino-acid dehydrogenase
MISKIPGWLLDPEGPLYIRLAYLPQAMPWVTRLLLAGRKSRVEQISTAMRELHRLTFECYEPLLRDAGCAHLVSQRGQLFERRLQALLVPSRANAAIRASWSR